MKNQQLTPENAFKIVFNAIGASELNSEDSQILGLH